MLSEMKRERHTDESKRAAQPKQQKNHLNAHAYTFINNSPTSDRTNDFLLIFHLQQCARETVAREKKWISFACSVGHTAWKKWVGTGTWPVTGKRSARERVRCGQKNEHVRQGWKGKMGGSRSQAKMPLIMVTWIYLVEHYFLVGRFAFSRMFLRLLYACARFYFVRQSQLFPCIGPFLEQKSQITLQHTGEMGGICSIHVMLMSVCHHINYPRNAMPQGDASQLLYRFAIMAWVKSK